MTSPGAQKQGNRHPSHRVPKESTATRQVTTIGSGYQIGRLRRRATGISVFEVTHPEQPGLLSLTVLTAPELRSPVAFAAVAERLGALAAIESLHAVRVLDVDQLDTGEPFFVTDAAAGVDLGSRVRTAGALPVFEAVRAVRHACRAVGEAHARGLLHGGLGIEHLYSFRDSNGMAYVKVDFSANDGPPPNPAPEQSAPGFPVDLGVDIWALGAILFELVTGRRALAGHDAPMTSCHGRVPPALDAIVRRCLAVDPNVRFTTVDDLAEALMRLTDDVSRPVRVMPPPLPAYATPAPVIPIHVQETVTIPPAARVPAFAAYATPTPTPTPPPSYAMPTPPPPPPSWPPPGLEAGSPAASYATAARSPAPSPYPPACPPRAAFETQRLERVDSGSAAVPFFAPPAAIDVIPDFRPGPMRAIRRAIGKARSWPHWGRVALVAIAPTFAVATLEIVRIVVAGH